MPLFGVFCWAFAILIPVRYFKKAPIVTITDKEINIGQQCIPWEEIETIRLTGKRNFPLIMNYPLEATTINLKSGQEQILFDDMYSNTAAMKQWLSHYFLHNLWPGDYRDASAANVDENGGETYKGQALFSLRGMLMWGLIGTFLFKMAKNPSSTAANLFLSIFCVGWFILVAYQMNYFMVTPTHLIVKNHYFFWKKKIYAIDNLQELVLETKPKMPNYLRVITKTFDNKLFAAGTLLDKDWRALQIRMEADGVKVRNEL